MLWLTRPIMKLNKSCFKRNKDHDTREISDSLLTFSLHPTFISSWKVQRVRVTPFACPIYRGKTFCSPTTIKKTTFHACNGGRKL